MGAIEASLVDAANATVFVRARDIGLKGTELPDELEARPDILKLLDEIRVLGSVRMGIAPSVEAARAVKVVPFVGFVSRPANFRTLAGDTVQAGGIDLAARIISNGQPHRALPLTGSLCTAVAAGIAGTVVAETLAPSAGTGSVRLGMPSGVLTVGADVVSEGGAWIVRAGSFYRTTRRLFDGRVWVPA